MPRLRGGQPTVLKVLTGQKQSRINNDEPQPEPGVPTCPTDDERVQEVWDYTVEQLQKMRTITMADRDTLHAYCENVVMFRDAMALIERDGRLVRGAHGGVLVRHPAFAIAKDAAGMMRSLGTLFGMSPGARSGIKVTDSQPKRDLHDASRLLSG